MKTKPTPPSKPPPPPKRMSIPVEIAEEHEAKLEWARVVNLMEGKLDERDRNLLIDYCLTHAEVMELRMLVDIKGRTLIGPKGGEYINPILNVMISRQSHLASLRRDLYFTPKSRIEKQSRANLSPAARVRGGVKDDDGQND